MFRVSTALDLVLTSEAERFLEIGQSPPLGRSKVGHFVINWKLVMGLDEVKLSGSKSLGFRRVTMLIKFFWTFQRLLICFHIDGCFNNSKAMEFLRIWRLGFRTFLGLESSELWSIIQILIGLMF